METIVEATIPADEFAMNGTVEALDTVQFRIERVAAQDAGYIMPLIWITGTDRDVIENSLGADPSVEAFELVTDLDKKWLYYMMWVDDIEALVRTIVKEDEFLLAAGGNNQTCPLKFHFLERKAVRRVQNYFETLGMSFDAHRIYDQRDSGLGAYRLTLKQYQTLTLAMDRGYYDIPRRISGQELAGELDISHQALSEQLRRAHKAVITDSIGMNVAVLRDDTDLFG